MRMRKRLGGYAEGTGTLPPSALDGAPMPAEAAAAAPRHTLILLLAIILLGLALRLVGIHWGLPSPEHAHSYHPDEILLDWAAQRTNPLWGDFDPGFYNYGSLTIFLLRLAHDFSIAIWPTQDAAWAIDARYHLLGRLLSVLFGVATIPLAFDLGRRIAGRLAGLAAAFVLAVTPAHVANSHYLAVDVPAAFFVTAALCAAVRLAERPRLRCALLAGALAGLAAATKYNAGLVLLAPLAALFLSQRRRPLVPGAEDGAWMPEAGPGADAAMPKRIGWLKLAGLVVACGVAAGAFFLAGCPGVILNTPAFLKDFLYEVHHVQMGHGNRFTGTLPAWIYHVVVSLRFGLGLPLLAAALIAVGRALRRPQKGDWVLAAWAIPYYLVIGGAQVKFLRYTVPLLPVIAVWVGVLAAQGLSSVGSSRWRALGALLLVGGAFWTLGSAIACSALFATVDPRDRAALAVQTQLPRGGTVALLNEPWFYTPPLVPWNGGTKTQGLFEESLYHGAPYAFLPGGSSLFLMGDLIDAPGLAAKLRDGTDPFTVSLRPRFTANLRSVLHGYSLGPEHWAALQGTFMAELNDLLRSGPFDAGTLRDGVLPGEALSILARPPGERDWVRLNRLILEAAYPQQIRARPVDWTAARLHAERPDCFIISSLEVRDDLRLGRQETRDLIAALDNDYRKLTFPPLAPWPGLFSPGFPPEDWLYPAPVVTVYLRR